MFSVFILIRNFSRYSFFGTRVRARVCSAEHVNPALIVWRSDLPTIDPLEQ